MAVAELRGLFSSVIYEGPPEPAQLRGLFASVIYEGPPEAAQLRGLFASVIHEGVATSGGGGYTSFDGAGLLYGPSFSGGGADHFAGGSLLTTPLLGKKA